MRTLLVVDVETGGLDPSVHPLLEIGMATWSVEHRCLVQALSIPVAAEANEAEAVNGIPAAMVRAHGLAPDKAHNVFAQRAAKADAIVSYGDFDRLWLQEKNGLAYIPWIDAMDLEWPKPSISRSLVAVALAHGVGVMSAHRALSDVMTLVTLLERVAEFFAIGERANIVTAFSGNRYDDFGAWLARALRPKVLYENADKGFSEKANEQYRAAGFFFDRPTKSWRKKCFKEDIAKLPFDVREVR